MNKANFSFLDELKLSDSVIESISRVLQVTIKGREDVLLTPLGRAHSPEKLLSEFDKVFKQNSNKMNSILIDLELSNKEKFGPRSIAKPWKERKQSLYASFESESGTDTSNLIPLKGDGRLRPLALNKSSQLLKNSTNSGLPYYVRKGTIKERVVKEFEYLIERKDPCVLFTRTQEQGKTRNVWGYPIADTLNEMMYYAPLLFIQRRLKYRAALLPPSEIHSAITKLLLKSRQSGNSLLSIDFSAYDNTVKSQLQTLAFDYIKSCFQRNYSDAIEVIFKRFNSISIITPDGVINGKHGVPSGSTFTNEVDSIVQATIALNTTYLTEDDFQVQGDDGVYAGSVSHLEDLVIRFESYKLLVSRGKTYLSSDYCIFLQCLYHIDYLSNDIVGGIYPVYRALNRLIFQERWSTFEDSEISGSDYYSIRSICIVENCKYHPLFRELVMFVLKYDKYSLTFTNEGLSKYVQMMEKTQDRKSVV